MTILNSISFEKKKPSGFFYGYIILAVSFLILFMVGASLFSFGVFLKPVLNEFGWSRAAISSAYSLNMVLGGIFGTIAGRISDRINPKISLTIGGLVMGLGFILMWQVGSLWQIYLFYGVLVSLGTAFVPIPLLSLVARWFDKGRGLASGIIMSGVGLGMLVGPPVSNLLISEYNWRVSYLLIGIVTLVTMIVLAQFLKSAPARNLKSEINTPVPERPEAKSRSVSLKRALSSRVLWTIVAMGFFFFFSAQIIFVHIVAYATDIGFSSVAAAAILSVIGFVGIGGTVGGGSLGDKIGTRNTMIIIFILAVISMIGFRLSGQLWMLYGCAVFFGLAYGGFTAVQSPLVAEYFGIKEHGAIFGIFMMAQNIGGAVGAVVAGSIYDFSGSYYLAFMVGIGVSLASLILSVFLKPVKK